MPKLKVNNGEIFYSVYGESNSNTIVLIHGFALDSRAWKLQIDELSKRNKVVVYDLRGFGKSTEPNGEYDHVEDLYSLMKLLNIKKALIVGHSFGGAIAINFALKHKKMVEGLILLSPSVDGYKVYNPFWEMLQKLGRKGDKEGIKKKMLEHDMFDRFPIDSEEYSFLKRFVSDYSCWHFLNKDKAKKYNTYERLRELKGITTKVIYGECEEEHVKDIANVVKNKVGAEVFELEGAGHMSNLEKPKLINKLIES